MPRQKKTESKQTKTEPEQKNTESKQTKAEPEQKKTEAQQTKVKPLVGEELLHKVKELEDLSKSEKAKRCGYYIVNKNGLERVNMMQFLNALVEAEGIDLDSQSEGKGRGGRSASYRISVQTNGNLLIGKAYTRQLGLNPGDEFEITLGRKHIRLKQVGAEEDKAVNVAS